MNKVKQVENEERLLKVEDVAQMLNIVKLFQKWTFAKGE